MTSEIDSNQLPSSWRVVEQSSRVMIGRCL